MAQISGINQEYLKVYDNFEPQEVGLAAINPNIYATERYREKKIDKILIGSLSSIMYTQFEHDPRPLIYVIEYEPEYKTILAVNLHYIPMRYRKRFLQVLLRYNKSNIKQKRPLEFDYRRIIRAVPPVYGAIRRYKIFGVRLLQGYKMNKWINVVSNSSLRFQNLYRKNLSSPGKIR